MADITHLPPETLMSEKASQRDRILAEVMQKLFNLLPEDVRPGITPTAFTLKDGTKCYITRFSEPKMRYQYPEGTSAARLPGEAEPQPIPVTGVMQYGFDVRFEDGKPLDHMEFSVRCTGFGGAI